MEQNPAQGGSGAEEAQLSAYGAGQRGTGSPFLGNMLSNELGDLWGDAAGSTDPRDGYSRLQSAVWAEYRRAARPMPWRQFPSAYWVFVSEVMLQQTQVPRVMQRFGSFVERFPSFDALAAADLADVLVAWQGLGYNRRARYLHDAARAVKARFGGTLPSDPHALTSLAGIGWNTAAAVVCYAFNQPVVFIETNVRRVFLHYLFPFAERVEDRVLQPHVEALLDRGNPREWYWALMDEGTRLAKTVPNPNRRSAHHARQAPFENSTRQLRGRIVRLLAERGQIAAEQIPTYAGASVERTTQALEGLERDGLCWKDGTGMVRAGSPPPR